MLKIFTLQNGLTAAAYNIPELRSLNLKISAKGGSLVESKEQEGLAHFMEHMLVQGTPSIPNAEALSTFVEGLAGSYNAYTSHTTVSFTMTVPFSHVHDALLIASEVFFEPLFPEEAIEKERRAVLNEIKQNMDTTWYKIYEFSRKTRFVPNSVLKLKTVGNIDVVSKIKREDLVDYWKKYFIPKNTYLLLSGNLSNLNLPNDLEKYFGKYQSKNTFPGFPELSRKELAGRKVAIRTDRKLRVNYVEFTLPGLSYYEKTLIKEKQSIAVTVLGRLRTSRLFQLLRYQKGLVYGVFASEYNGLGVGTVHISSEVSSEHLEEVILLIAEELASFKKKGPSKEELAFTKNYLSNKWLMSFDHPSAIADWVNAQFMWKDTVHMPEDYIQMIKDITPEDVAEVMQQYWDMQKLQLIIQGPTEGSKENIEKFTGLITNKLP